MAMLLRWLVLVAESDGLGAASRPSLRIAASMAQAAACVIPAAVGADDPPGERLRWIKAPRAAVS